MADTTVADHMASDMYALSALATEVADRLDAGESAPADMRAALHSMRQIVNRAENRLDAVTAERVRLARTPGSPHGNTRPPAGNDHD